MTNFNTFGVKIYNRIWIFEKHILIFVIMNMNKAYYYGYYYSLPVMRPDMLCMFR